MNDPNRIGMNILDTQQLPQNHDRVLQLIHDQDMGAVTVVHATHKKEAKALIHRIARERGARTDIFFRDISALPDERNPASMRPDEWFKLMYGHWQDTNGTIIPVTWNEAQEADMTNIVNWSLGCIELAASIGMRVCTWKTNNGTPIGYMGEEPDNYAIANPLWKLAVALNKPRMDAGLKPLVYIAPHMAFSIYGKGEGGSVDRPQEIIGQLQDLGLDPKYLPIHFGELTTLGGGWRAQRARGVDYAHAFDRVFRKWFDPYGGVAQFYCFGDQQTNNGEPGMWWSEDLSGRDALSFWAELKALGADGRYRMRPFVAQPPVPIEEPPPSPVETYTLSSTTLAAIERAARQVLVAVDAIRFMAKKNE